MVAGCPCLLVQEQETVQTQILLPLYVDMALYLELAWNLELLVVKVMGSLLMLHFAAPGAARSSKPCFSPSLPP